jgi:hypothetical protein
MIERKTVLAVLACGAAVAVVSLRVWTHLNVPGEPHVPRYALQDFRDAVYYPALAFVHGENPYDQPPYMAAYPVGDGLAPYSPLTLFLHAPITFLPYRAAELVYYGVSVALTVALGALALALCGVRLTVARVAALGAALLLSRPGHWNLFNGQVTLQVVLPMLVALWCARDRPLLAGVALAVTTFKPTYGLPLAALLAFRGEWRPVIVGGVVAGAFTTLVLVRLVTAAGGVAPFVAAIQSSYAARGLETRKQPEHSPYRVDVVALAGRLLGRSPTIAETLVLTAATLAVAAFGLRRTRRRGAAVLDGAGVLDGARGGFDRDARVHAASIASLGILACCYHQQYDLVVLALPLAALVWRADAWPWRGHPMVRAAALALVVVPLVNYLGSGTGIATLGLSSSALLAASSLDNLALLALLAIFVAAAGYEPHDIAAA